ncbi:UNVERIFIED_CONTAM: hypothetical protein FKN15_008512 [Acipenser sinensis]
MMLCYLVEDMGGAPPVQVTEGVELPVQVERGEVRLPPELEEEEPAAFPQLSEEPAAFPQLSVEPAAFPLLSEEPAAFPLLSEEQATLSVTEGPLPPSSTEGLLPPGVAASPKWQQKVLWLEPHKGELLATKKGGSSQVAGQPGTVACLVPCSTPPGFPDVVAQEEDVTEQWTDIADASPAGCFVPPSYCSAPPGIPDVTAQLHSHAPLSASPCSRSPACAVVALDMPSGSLLAGPGSLPGNAGGTDPPSSPPVEKGEN